MTTVAEITRRLVHEAAVEAVTGKELAVRHVEVIGGRSSLEWGVIQARKAQRRTWARRLRHGIRWARQALTALRLIVALWAREVRSAYTSRGQTWRLAWNTAASALAALALVYVGLRSVGWLPW